MPYARKRKRNTIKGFIYKNKKYPVRRPRRPRTYKSVPGRQRVNRLVSYGGAHNAWRDTYAISAQPQLGYAGRGLTRGKARLKRRCNSYKKVNYKFMTKVEGVLNKDIPCGVLTDVDPALFTHTARNRQLVLSYSLGSNGAEYNMFSWSAVAYAAAVLYNGKAQSSTGMNTNAPTGTFADTVKIHVESQSTVFRIKNLFYTSGTLKAITCFPKSSTSTPSDPAACWNDAINEYSNLTVGGVATNDQTFIGDMPTNYHKFNQFFKTHIETIHMAPGTQKTLVRNGPCMTYDFTKSRPIANSGPYYYHTTGVNQYMMFVWIPDLINQATGALPGGVQNGYPVHLSQITQTGGLAIERTYKVCVRAPDETDIARKKQVFAKGQWYTAGTTNNFQDVEQPSSSATAVV